MARMRHVRTLGPPTDPIRFRVALAIRVRAGRYAEAAGLIRERVPDERWIDIAAGIFAPASKIWSKRSGWLIEPMNTPIASYGSERDWGSLKGSLNAGNNIVKASRFSGQGRGPLPKSRPARK